MDLSTVKPREQNGRDSFARYRAQVRSAALASLSILEDSNIDRVYCDLHDDFVVRDTNNDGDHLYLFYQVKTKGKQNHQWSINDLFGLKKTKSEIPDNEIEKFKNSFIGKLILHTVVFDDKCSKIVFQTNIYNKSEVDDLIKDIKSAKFAHKCSQALLNGFNKCFKNELSRNLNEEEIKSRLRKIKFENDVQHLKENDHNFESLIRDRVYQFSEIDLSQSENIEIMLKLLHLVEEKSSGIIHDLTPETIETEAGISINDLLKILSVSRDAYQNLKNGGDLRAIKTASIIQRSLTYANLDTETIDFCSRVKSEWDIWLRNNRHIIPEIQLRSISLKIKRILEISHGTDGNINLATVYKEVQSLFSSLQQQKTLYGLSENLILGGFFSEYVKAKSNEL